ECWQSISTPGNLKGKPRQQASKFQTPSSKEAQAPSSKTDLRAVCPGICFWCLSFGILWSLGFGAWCFAHRRLDFFRLPRHFSAIMKTKTQFSMIGSLLVAFALAHVSALGQAPPTPGPEHEHLKKLEGTWNAKMKMGDNETPA